MGISRFIALTVFSLLLCSGGTNALAGYDKSYVGDQVDYRAEDSDTFVHLARDYNLGFVEMRSANPNIDPWIPGEGTRLVLPTRHLLPDAPRDGIIINIPEMRLYAFIHGDEAPVTFPLGVGREGLDTPIGMTTVVRKAEGPSWRPTARMRKEDPELPAVVLPGPENPLGTHALYLGWPQYAIHGTNRPFGIGRRVSSGCIRMYPEDIVTFYETIPIGTKVTVVNQPIKVGWIGNKLYLEAHTSVDQAVDMEEKGQVKEEDLTEEELHRILSVAGEYKDRLRWPAIRKAVRERRGYPVDIARRPTIEVDRPDDEAFIQEVRQEDVESAKEALGQETRKAEVIPSSASSSSSGLVQEKSTYNP